MQMAHLSIIPECYSIYLVIFSICISPEGCFWAPTGANTQSVHPIEVCLLNLLFWPYMYHSLALATHTCIKGMPVPTVRTSVYRYELKLVLKLWYYRVFPTNDVIGTPLWHHWGIPSLISPNNNKLWHWYQYLLICLLVLLLFQNVLFIHVSPLFSYWMDCYFLPFQDHW